ncbi:FadR/GntR family transcriptional regulator [Streptomyces sp. NPDC087270]|uniref:FadR/GntR family transcriptional regulator n=1 Tax=Streptomyces sp. NPDC087270 TaxID=3365774 RepID=UPI00382CAFAB
MAVIDGVVAEVRKLIIEGRLRPGDRLPQESDFAEQLGVSRSSLREAVRVLEQMRVLDVRHGSGTYVSSLQPAQLLEGIAFAVEVMRDETLREVIETRELLEPAATRLAVTRMTPENLDRIRDTYERHTRQRSIEGLVHSDLEFHAEIVRATGNQTLISLLDGLSSRTVRLRLWGGIVSDNAVDLTIQHHHNILSAIEAGDAHGAECAAYVHVTTARRWLDAYFADHGKPA